MKFLYISHFLSAWGDRMWEFAVALLFIDVFPSSIFLVSLFGFAEAAAITLFGSIVGGWVDVYPRLWLVRWFLVAQNALVGLSAVALLMLMWFTEETHSETFAHYALVTIAVLAGAFAKVASVGSSVSVEKDWVRVVCAGNSKRLAHVNSVMRRIDLVCKILAPSLVGVVISFSASTGALLIALWNILGGFLEYILIVRAYNSYPALAEPPQPKEVKAGEQVQKKTWWRQSTRTCRMMVVGYRAYWSQTIAWGAWALAALYFTVLSFGSLMTGYLTWAGMPQSVLGVTRGIGAVFGVGATFAYSRTHKRKGVNTTGSISIVSELACLVPCALAALFSIGSLSWSPESLGSLGATPAPSDTALGAGRVPWVAMIILMAGVVTARFGLWMFDLSVTQLLQEHVAKGEVGLVNGFQNSAQQIMTMGVYFAGMLVSNPEDFGWLVLLSIAVVAGATLSWFRYSCSSKANYTNFEDGAPPVMPHSGPANAGAGSGSGSGQAGTRPGSDSLSSGPELELTDVSLTPMPTASAAPSTNV